MRARNVALALAFAGAGGGIAADAPLTLPGWPVTAPAGSVVPGPVPGGPLVVGRNYRSEVATPPYVVVAVGPDGREIWRYERGFACGNCAENPRLEEIERDEHYGGFGRPAGCPGVLLTDGTCIASTTEPFPVRPGVTARRRDGSIVWRHEERDLAYIPGTETVPRHAVADSAGTVYAVVVEDRVVALDVATGALRWRLTGAQTVAPLADGVVTRSSEGLVAYGADGTRRWVVPPPPDPNGVFLEAFSDPAQGRVYVQWRVLEGTGRGQVLAIDSKTGVVLWRTGQAGGLSVTPGGHLLVSVPRTGGAALRALGPDGRVRWEVRTLEPVWDAVGLPDGTVAYTQSGDPVGDGIGLVVRVDPRKREPVPPRASVSLSRSLLRGTCNPGVGLGGTILRVSTPRSAPLVVRVLPAVGPPLAPLRFRAPAGRSFVGLGLCADAMVRVKLGATTTRLRVRRA